MWACEFGWKEIWEIFNMNTYTSSGQYSGFLAGFATIALRGASAFDMHRSWRASALIFYLFNSVI